MVESCVYKHHLGIFRPEVEITKMLAVEFDGELKVSEVPLAPIPSGEVRIEMLMSGICNTDLEICRGYMNYRGILGHEFVGIVSECGADIPRAEAERWLGQRVVGEINCGCGKCRLCLGGDTRHCQQRTTLGIDRRPGTFAQCFNLPVANLYEVPDNISNSQAIFAEPLAAAWNILEQVHAQPNSKVLILGDGKLGQLTAQVLRLTACDLTVVGKHSEKLQLLQKQNIKTALLPEWREYLGELSAYDLAVEATGSAEGLDLVLRSVRPRGTVVVKSTVADRLSLDFSAIVVREINIVGSRCGRFAPALRSLEMGLIDTAPLLEGVYPLSDAVEAFAQAQQGKLKVALVP